MLPQEHAELWDYLATTGAVWARALADGGRECRYEPGPPAQFLKRFAKQIQAYDCVDFYLGFKDAILKPRFETVTMTVGGKEVVQSKPGVWPQIATIVGAKKVREVRLDPAGSQLIRYRYGVINRTKVMDRTTASYYTSFPVGDKFERHPKEFVMWARKAIAWLKKRIAGEVPVYRCNYSIPASALTIRSKL
jgi:hypothetical protein